MLTDPILKSKVDALWDKFWSGGIANPITAIESRVVPKNGTPRGLRTLFIKNNCVRSTCPSFYKATIC